MKLFIHLGLHRTGTHTLRFHLWEKHPQINYLGRFQRDSGEKHLELTELISKLNNDDFDKRYNELLKKAGEIKLISNKINLISDECIWAYAFKDSKKDDKYKTLSRFVSRTNLLFSKINVDVNFFYIIRDQENIIKSMYSRSAPDWRDNLIGQKYGGLKFTANKILALTPNFGNFVRRKFSIRNCLKIA